MVCQFAHLAINLLIRYICIDIDECALSIDGCQYICNNNAGSFVCSCNTGYALASDDRDCFGEYNV